MENEKIKAQQWRERKNIHASGNGKFCFMTHTYTQKMWAMVMIKPTHNFGFLLYVHPLSVFLIPKCLRDRERELSFFDRKNIVSPYMIKVVYRYDDDHLKHKSEQKMCFRLFFFSDLRCFWIRSWQWEDERKSADKSGWIEKYGLRKRHFYIIVFFTNVEKKWFFFIKNEEKKIKARKRNRKVVTLFLEPQKREWELRKKKIDLISISFIISGGREVGKNGGSD